MLSMPNPRIPHLKFFRFLIFWMNDLSQLTVTAQLNAFDAEIPTLSSDFSISKWYFADCSESIWSCPMTFGSILFWFESSHFETVANTYAIRSRSFGLRHQFYRCVELQIFRRKCSLTLSLLRVRISEALPTVRWRPHRNQFRKSKMISFVRFVESPLPRTVIVNSPIIVHLIFSSNEWSACEMFFDSTSRKFNYVLIERVSGRHVCGCDGQHRASSYACVSLFGANFHCWTLK